MNQLDSFGPNRNFCARIYKTILDHNMFANTDRVLVGVSGGPDSVALLHALFLLKDKLPLRLGVAHLNHCLRGHESDSDAKFVQDLINQYSLPFYCEKIDVAAYGAANGLGLEQAGRKMRQAFFSQIQKKHSYDKIALGHHADDNAEWVLMSLMRGTGPAGLAGIPLVNGLITRPLARMPKKEIKAFCVQNKLKWVEDKSNADTKFLRNKVRHELLPMLKAQYNPKIHDAINRLSEIMRDEENWWESKIKQIIESWNQETPGSLKLPVSDILENHPALCRRIVRAAIARVKGESGHVTLEHVENILELARSDDPHAQAHLPEGIAVQRHGLALVIEKHADPDWARKKARTPLSQTWERTILRPGMIQVSEAGYGIEVSVISARNMPDFKENADTAFFDHDLLEFPLILRPWRAGDSFVPLGAGGSQKIKKYFIDHKISGPDRKNACVIESRGKIAWLVGMRIAGWAKVRPKTSQVLCIKLFLA